MKSIRWCFVFVVGCGVVEAQGWYFHPDHLGSTHFVTDPDGAVIESVTYTPFGETIAVIASGAKQSPDHLFTSKELDPESALYYYGARYYDPVLARFPSVDPISSDQYRADPQQQNRYVYARENPLHYTDPDGRLLKEVGNYVAGQLPLLDRNLMDGQEALRYLFQQQQMLEDRLAMLTEHPNIRILELEEMHPHLRGHTDLLNRLVADERASVGKQLAETKKWVWWIRGRIMATKLTRGGFKGVQRVSTWAEGITATEATVTGASASAAEGGAVATQAASVAENAAAAGRFLSRAGLFLRWGSVGLTAVEGVRWSIKANEMLTCDPGASCPGALTPLRGPEENIGTSPGQISPLGE